MCTEPTGALRAFANVTYQGSYLLTTAPTKTPYRRQSLGLVQGREAELILPHTKHRADPSDVCFLVKRLSH